MDREQRIAAFRVSQEIIEEALRAQQETLVFGAVLRSQDRSAEAEERERLGEHWINQALCFGREILRATRSQD